MKTHPRCGRLVSGLDGALAEDQTVIVEDGVVRFVGATAAAPPSLPGDIVHYAQGRFVMPGLIDLHVHLSYGNAKTMEDVDLFASVEFRAIRGLAMAQRVLAAGCTSIVDPGGSGNVTLAIRDAIGAELFPGPRTTCSGPYITTRQGLTDSYPTWIGVPPTAIGRLVRNRDEAIDEFRRQVKDGVDYIKVALDGTATDRRGRLLAAYPQDEITAMVAEAHRLDRPVIAHARGAEAVRYAARAGVDLIFLPRGWTRRASQPWSSPARRSARHSPSSTTPPSSRRTRKRRHARGGARPIAASSRPRARR